jgi:hypothetical protein
VIVGTNGGIQLGEDGDDNDIDYDHSASPSELDDFYDDGGFPTIFVFNSDIDLSTTGTVHFKDFGDRAVFTWNEVGTNEEEEHLLSFQIQLFADGTIYFSYNGILDRPDEDLVTSLDQGILVGISGSTGTDPGVVDLTTENSTDTDTIYELWKYTSDPKNDLFDLDQETLVFEPKAGGGFISYLLAPIMMTGNVNPVPDLLIGKTATSMKGDGLRNPKQASPKQSILHQCKIFTDTETTSRLTLQNDGRGDGDFRFTTSGDRFPRMTVTARASVGGNISAAILTGRYAPKIPSRGAVRVTYRLRTDRYYAGTLRGGDRDDTVSFRLSGGGTSDNAAMTNVYR